MTAAEGTYLGFAKQTAFGTPNTTDASFQYLLFRRGAAGPRNIVIPLGPEVGGGAMERNVVKVGVSSGGGLEFIPRPQTLGHMLLGMSGSVSTSGSAAPYTHTFNLSTDQFDAPWYTARLAPGNLWGEQFPDSRFTTLTLDWRAADFVTGTVAFIGRTPEKVATTTWSAATYVDGGPQFLAPLGSIEVPDNTDIDVLGGSFMATSMIPLDQQYVVGAYAPKRLDIVHRAFVLTMGVLISDTTLYTKMMYDPDAGSSWVAEIFKEADIELFFESDQVAGGSTPYKFQIAANGQSQASGDANVAWSCTPLDIVAQRQLVLQVTGTFLASPTVDQPITFTLINDKASY